MKKIVKQTGKTVKDSIISKLSEVSASVIEILMESYDVELTVTDRNSKTNPQESKYRDEFEKRLLEFEYIKDNNGEINFSLPSMETFDFSGNSMKVIEQILEGTTGIYVEVNAKDYEQMFGKRIISRDPLDTSVPKKELIYLMKYDNVVRVAERNTFGRNNYLVRYPFSNTPPILVLDAADIFVKNNMDKWIDESVDNSVKTAKKGM